ARDFPDRARALIEGNGGQVIFVALKLPLEEQERGLVDEGRAAFGKMRDPSLLRTLRPQFDACMAWMPQPALTLDVGNLTPSAAVRATHTPASCHAHSGERGWKPGQPLANTQC